MRRVNRAKGEPVVERQEAMDPDHGRHHRSTYGESGLDQRQGSDSCDKPSDQQCTQELRLERWGGGGVEGWGGEGGNGCLFHKGGPGQLTVVRASEKTS